MRIKIIDGTRKGKNVKELPGYAQYAKKVRYRLLPGVW